MRSAGPELSPSCTRSEHGQCAHHMGGLQVWRRRPREVAILCRCPCHATCALAGRRTVPRGAWEQECSCPGAAALRESFARASGRRAELDGIVAGVDLSDHPDAEEIEIRLRAVFEEHGRTPPPGTRLPRLLWQGLRGVANTVRWSSRPGWGPDRHDREETRKAYRAVGVVAIVATLLTAAAVASTGWRRLVWGVIASVAWLFSGYAVSLVTAVAQIARAAENRGARGDSDQVPRIR